MLRRTFVPLVLALAAALAAPPTGAQAQSGGVVITSQPPGAVVELSGENVFRGVTPWRMDRAVPGAYQVRAVKAGFEVWEGYLVVSAARRDSLSIRLVAKTQLRAGLRSAILPGWGQCYTGQKGKGAAFAIAEVAALAGVFWTDLKRGEAQDDYDDAEVAYDSADQADEIEATYAELLRAYHDLEKWHEQRKRWSYAAAAVWLANVLDATLLFPAYGGGLFADAGGQDSGFYASVEPDRTSVGFAVRF
jgi:hypothetical protein